MWGAIIAGIVITCLCFHPFTWQTEDRVMAGSPITLTAQSDFLIVVDYGNFEASPNAFDKMNFSLTWLNTLQQEIGPVSLMDADDFATTDLSSYRCIIITKSAATHDAWVPKLRSFLERGGTLVMEMPEGAMRTIASADGKGGLRAAQNITFTSGIAPELQTALAALDLSNRTEVIGSAGPLDDSTTYMTIDGVPVMYTKKYAMGHVVTVDFNYGMLITSLQQGRPLDNFSIRNQHDTTAIETSDLSVPDGMSLETPLADLIERFLFYGVIGQVMPVVGYWPYFDGTMGALLVSHHEQGIGDLAVWMPEYEATFKATSTMFVKAPVRLTEEGAAALRSYRTEVGLAYDLSSSAEASKPLGPMQFSPIWQRLNLSEQMASVLSVLGENAAITTSQSVNGLWSSHYTRQFRALAAADLKADASYRPPTGTAGYAFMTGMPFMPLDTNGKLFNLMEFPVTHAMVETDEDIETVQKFLVDSESNTHECLNITLEPNFFIEKPSIATFNAWKQLYVTAHEHNHWITSITYFIRFSRARYNAELQSREGTGTYNNKRTHVLRLETLAPETGMMLSVPATRGQKQFVEARRGVNRVRDDARLPETLTPKPVTVFGFERLLLPLSKGFNAIDIVYE